MCFGMLAMYVIVLCLLFRQHYNDSYLFLITVLFTLCMLLYVSLFRTLTVFSHFILGRIRFM